MTDTFYEQFGRFSIEPGDPERAEVLARAREWFMRDGLVRFTEGASIHGIQSTSSTPEQRAASFDEAVGRLFGATLGGGMAD
jgi:hypothetical protein